jgi:hypothetical protein
MRIPSKWPRYVVYVLVILTIVWISNPEWLWAGWRLTHANPIHWRYLTVAVPVGWVPREDLHSLGLARLSRLPWGKGSFVYIRVEPSLRGNTTDYLSRWADNRAHEDRAEAFRFSSIISVSAGGHAGTCLEYVLPSNHAQMESTCAVPDLGLLAAYYGPRRLIPDFYTLVKNIEGKIPGDQHPPLTPAASR